MKKNSIDIQHSCLDPGIKRRDDGERLYNETVHDYLIDGFFSKKGHEKTIDAYAYSG